jgi:hypothetical protein
VAEDKATTYLLHQRPGYLYLYLYYTFHTILDHFYGWGWGEDGGGVRMVLWRKERKYFLVAHSLVIMYEKVGELLFPCP